MSAVRIDGGGDDLGRFSRSVAEDSASVDVLSPFERRLRWSAKDRSGAASVTTLRSGLVLSASSVRWERAWSMTVDHAASPLKFMLIRGPGPRLTAAAESHDLGGNTTWVSQMKRPTRLQFDFDDRGDGVEHAQLSVELGRDRLAELLGTDSLPESVARVVSSDRDYPRSEQAMGPNLGRLFDEVVHCDARGTSRQLHLEAKGLELLAVIIDELEEESRAVSPRLSPDDRDRLEQARQILLANLEDPPHLPALARRAGLNEAKLKAGFRALFGSPVYAYLRDHRMEEARRLLRRRYSVTEVAGRVGYRNPSKFAAAFRKRFGISPSHVR